MTENLFPDYVDIYWDRTNIHHRFDYKKHPVRDDGGNPVCVWRHPMGFGGGGLHDCTVSGQPGNALFSYLMQPDLPLHFDWITIETVQGQWVTPTAVPHLPQTFQEPQTPNAYWPINCAVGKDVIKWIRGHAIGGIPVTALSGTLGINKDKIFVAGCSAGANFWTTNMFLGHLSGVCGFIDYAGPIDFRSNNGIDTVHWSWLQNYLGTFSQSAWNAAPASGKQQLSMMWWLGRGAPNYIPTYVIFEDVGNGKKPYGDPAYINDNPPSNIHDGSMYYELRGGLSGMNLPHDGDFIARQAWNSVTHGTVISERILHWMSGILN